MKEKIYSAEDGGETNRETKESKSQRKRAMDALQKLGESLIVLPASQLNRLPISESLRRAIDEAKLIKSRSALRRQRQLIGRLMRQENVAEIEKSLAESQQKQRTQNEHFHAAERWRDRLLSNDENAVTEFINQYPDAQGTQLRQLIRSAMSESKGKPCNRSRALFRYIYSLINTA